MKKTLLKVAALAAFCLLASVPGHAQPSHRVKNNNPQHVVKIELEYLLDDGVWRPARNFRIPAETIWLRFKGRLQNSGMSRLRARLELRKVCDIELNDPPGLSKRSEFFGATTVAGGNDLTVIGRSFEIPIRVHPPENSDHPDLGQECRGDHDHLGGGPYDATLSVAEGGSDLMGGNDALNLVYTQGFISCTADSTDPECHELFRERRRVSVTANSTRRTVNAADLRGGAPANFKRRLKRPARAGRQLGKTR